MKKPLLSIDEPEPKKATRADRPPVEGFATIVDGHFKSEFDTAEAAEAAGRKLKSAYPAAHPRQPATKEDPHRAELASPAIASPVPDIGSPEAELASFVAQQPRQIFFNLALVLASSAMKGSL